MAKAITVGLLKNPSFKIKASAPSLKDEIDEFGIETCSSNIKVLDSANVLILAVKPHQIESVLLEIKNHLDDNTVVVSVAAGITLEWFDKHLKAPIVRAMPNIGSAVGQGATPLMANAHITGAHQAMVAEIFNAIGITSWVKTVDELNAFTALSGSGPAYVFLFIEAMIHAATALGVDAESAKAFALQTASGAVVLANDSQLDLASLRRQVTSPGGTTEAAIGVFNESNQLFNLVQKALEANIKRSHELSNSQQ